MLPALLKYNGGKSNIVDAIRWVLGEQKSTELRLDKMSSVIFNGTKIKKPAGMAQVSLFLKTVKIFYLLISMK
jgi:chromosome segregation protein